MHELSLALEVCRITEERIGSAALPGVRTVAVEVGAASGVAIENFRFCLESLLAAPPFAGARPLILDGPGDELRVSYLEVDDGRPDD